MLWLLSMLITSRCQNSRLKQRFSLKKKLDFNLSCPPRIIFLTFYFLFCPNNLRTYHLLFTICSPMKINVCVARSHAARKVGWFRAGNVTGDKTWHFLNFNTPVNELYVLISLKGLGFCGSHRIESLIEGAFWRRKIYTWDTIKKKILCITVQCHVVSRVIEISDWYTTCLCASEVGNFFLVTLHKNIYFWNETCQSNVFKSLCCILIG